MCVYVYVYTYIYIYTHIHYTCTHTHNYRCITYTHQVINIAVYRQSPGIHPAPARGDLREHPPPDYYYTMI